MVETKPAEKVYKVPNLTVDAIVTREKENNEHEILLITRGKDPFKGHYAFPGGFVDYNEDPVNAVLRELKEECLVEGARPELICVNGDPKRDPRKHIVTIAYHCEVEPNATVQAGDDAATAKWYNLRQVCTEFQMAFDHKDILQQFLTKKLPQYL